MPRRSPIQAIRTGSVCRKKLLRPSERDTFVEKNAARDFGEHPRFASPAAKMNTRTSESPPRPRRRYTTESVAYPFGPGIRGCAVRRVSLRSALRRFPRPGTTKQFRDAYPMTPARIADPNVAQDHANLESPIVTNPNRAGKLKVRNALCAPACFRCASLRGRKGNTLTGVL